MVEEKGQQPENVEPSVEPSGPSVEPSEVDPKTYELHIRIPEEMRPILQNATILAHKMGDIAKPELASLMNLYIAQGLAIQKRKWLNRMGMTQPK